MQRKLCGLRNGDQLGKERWRNAWGRYMVICISLSLSLTCVPFSCHLPSRIEWFKKWRFCSLGNASFYCVLKSGSSWGQIGSQEQCLIYSRVFFSGRRLQPSKSCTQMGRFTWRISRWRHLEEHLVQTLTYTYTYIHICSHLYPYLYACTYI